MRTPDTQTQPSDGSRVTIPDWVEPHTLYVARCSQCRATPDQDGGEFRKSPWEAARVVNEIEGSWRLEDGALLCPDCACIDCPDCDGTGDEDGYLVPQNDAEPCPRCKGESYVVRGEDARYEPQQPVTSKPFCGECHVWRGQHA